jgi:phosphosulfolactate phosphohydrolase-like enzyme
VRQRRGQVSRLEATVGTLSVLEFVSVPAGEKCEDDGSLRPAFEDLFGARAILSNLQGSLSPEAATAVETFQAFQQDLLGYLKQCISGKELIARGFESDVKMASAYNVSDCVPVLMNKAYIKLFMIFLFFNFYFTISYSIVYPVYLVFC